MATCGISDINRIVFLTVSLAKRRYKPAVLQKILTEMHEHITDVFIAELIEVLGYENEHWVFESIIKSSTVSADLAHAILERAEYNERLCKIALQTYAGTYRLRELLFSAIAHQEDLSRKLSRFIEKEILK